MRIRTVKPEFWKNEELARLPEFARLMALALLNYADDEGYFLADHRLIRGELFPFDDDSSRVQRAISDLSNAKYLTLYNGTNGRMYGHVVNFKKHQKIDRGTPSKIKPLLDFAEPSSSTQRALALGTGIREQGIGSGNGEQGAAPAAVVPPATSELPLVPSFPAVLETPEFKTAWADWIEYRRERRLPAYKPKSQVAQLTELAGWGHDAAIYSIRESIRQQWQGLFPPKVGITKPNTFSQAPTAEDHGKGFFTDRN
ncbi:MAG: hypothetical protein K0R17_3552 [Rariglobus sp.]|jgi:hypothetical protein|nr:hypothetical protein [Rariglobus sp.]